MRREDQDPANLFAVRKTLFDLWKRKYCFASGDRGGCSETYSASHSISKSGSLKLIAKDQHVCSLQGDFGFVDGASSYLDSIKIVDVSINKASTFYGFCSRHDGLLFQELDRLDLTDHKRFFWQLFYRALAFERYSKLAAVEFADELRALDKGLDISEQVDVQFQAVFNKWSHGEGLRHINLLFQILDAMRGGHDFSGIHYLYYHTSERLPFAGVGCFQPSMTYLEEVVQRVNIVYPKELFRPIPARETVCMAAIPMKAESLLCFCCLNTETKAMKFIDDFAKAADRPASNFLAIMMLSLENVFFSPKFLRGLKPNDFSLLRRLSSLGIAEDLTSRDIKLAKTVGCFDGVNCVPFTDERRH